MPVTKREASPFDAFESVSSTKLRLRPHQVEAFYLIAYHLQLEYHAQLETHLRAMATMEGDVGSKAMFLRHAKSTLAMLSDRLLKSFPKIQLIASYPDVRDIIVQARKSMSTVHKKKVKVERKPSDTGEKF